MDLNQILKELRTEHGYVVETILALERYAAGGAPKRGRPPAWLAEARKTMQQKSGIKRPAMKKKTADLTAEPAG